MGRHWYVQRKMNTDLFIVVTVSIFGFVVLIVLMIFASGAFQR
jgi:hypothetical protein